MRFQYRHANGIWRIVLTLLAVLAALSGAVADMARTDAQKKDAVYGMYREYKKDFPSVRDITPIEARVLLQQQRVVFIDARKPEERAVSMLPGALPMEVFMKDPSTAENKTAVAYCTIGYRSGVFAREMEGKGRKVFNLSGGILAWALEGGRLYDAQGETRRIHVYGKKWDYAPDGYDAVVFGFLEGLLK